MKFNFTQISCLTILASINADAMTPARSKLHSVTKRFFLGTFMTTSKLIKKIQTNEDNVNKAGQISHILAAMQRNTLMVEDLQNDTTCITIAWGVIPGLKKFFIQSSTGKILEIPGTDYVRK